MRKLALLVSLVLLVMAIASPASATKPGTDPVLEDGHKIWICHATRSLSNPYVKILIDIAAWDVEDPDSNDHGPQHHAREKDGVEWADYALESPDDECGIDPPPTCEFADYVVTFPGTKLIAGGTETLTVGAAIPAGAYDVVLVSSDVGRGGGPDPLVQNNEQWRLRGGEPGAYIGASGYTTDLVDTVADIFDVETLSSITFDSAVEELTAEHWNFNVANSSTSADSVVPQAVCLTAEEFD